MTDNHVLARRGGPELVVNILLAMGAACPHCGYGTRVTSKRWAKCKKCGSRVRRHTSEEIVAAADRAASTQGEVSAG